MIEALPTMPPTLFVKQSAADFLARLDEIYPADYPEAWQWRVTSNGRSICRHDGFRVATQVTCTIHYFGWKNGNYHKFIDPVAMYGHSLDAVWPGTDSVIARLMKWATTLRDFCHENGIEVRPTTGAIAAQFLTDPRFYPNPRRKVPRATNDAVRQQLPGNHYHLEITPTPNHEFTAHYLDQHRAHHYHARTSPLPDANRLYAYGDFTTLEEVVFTDVADDFYGLYCLDLEADTDPKFSWLQRVQLNNYSDTLQRRFERLFVYSNELPHLLDSGYRVTGVRAAWGSRGIDTGIPLYAQWCEEQLAAYDAPKWLKQLLLSTYGVLAAKPKEIEAIFKIARSGEPVHVPTGQRMLSGLHTKSAQKLDPNIANVLHRGMIEAATRSESVGLAQWLTHQGHRVLSIYADAVIIEVDDDKELPPLPEPWGVKTTLNHLQYINHQAFMSSEMTKLPGVSQELRRFRQASPGVAPRRVHYDALTGQPIPAIRS